MTTRFDAKGNGAPSGYSNPTHAPDVVIPSCGIEDVDRAVFHLFDKELPLQVGDAEETKKPKVIFATGERWAIIKKKKEFRDRNNSLILPLITMGRTSVTQDVSSDITGRGINQQTGEIVVKRQLHEGDRSYQNLINKLFIKNSPDTAVSSVEATSGLRTRGDIGSLSLDPDVIDGVYLANKKHADNIWETITIPAPQFFTAKYEITFWAMYTSHVVQMLDGVMAAMLPQGRSFKVSNPINPSYWFIATIDSDFEPDNTFDAMQEQERIIRYNFTLSVPGYIIGTSAPGTPVPVRKQISSPKIDFATSLVDEGVNFDETLQGNDPFLGSDDPTLPFEHDLPSQLTNDEMRDTGHDRLEYGQGISSKDPAVLNLSRGQKLKTYQKLPVVGPDGVTRYRNVRVTTGPASSGETTYSAVDLTLSDVSLIVTKG